jgi:hypothetical protein
MPAGVDHDRWEKAKARASAQGHAKDWPYIMAIYNRMMGKKKKTASWARRIVALLPKGRA